MLPTSVHAAFDTIDSLLNVGPVSPLADPAALAEVKAKVASWQAALFPASKLTSQPDEALEVLRDPFALVGTWWRAADGGRYGYAVTGYDPDTQDFLVLSTDGLSNRIDVHKLLARYTRVAL